MNHFSTPYFTYSESLKHMPEVYEYVGGPSSDTLSKFKTRLIAKRLATVARGRAYWIRTDRYADYYGPLKVTVLGSGNADFGRKLNTVTLRVKNVSDPLQNETVSATFELIDSAAAPGEGIAAPPVPLRVRGERDANLQYTYTALPHVVSLAPGEQRDLVLDANRTRMPIPDQSYEGVLRVTDSLGHSRIDLPVSAIGTSRSGVWVGAAILDSVNRVEVIRGPESDAPLGTPNGEGPETVETTERRESTIDGMTTLTRRFNTTFDSSNSAYFDSGGIEGANVVVSSLADGKIFQEGKDYTTQSSKRATVTSGGSGYTSPPKITFEGGGGNGAAAVATIAAGVRRVAMETVGSTYPSAPSVTFTGGGGSGTNGVALFAANGNSVTGVTIEDGGFGYITVPEVIFSGGGGGTGAAGIAIIGEGKVTGVAITNAGTGYILPPTVTFQGLGEDARGFGTIETTGTVADVKVTHGGSDYSMAPTVGFTFGSGASATAEITGDAVTAVNVDVKGGGSNYTEETAKVILTGGGGTGARATALVEDGVITGVSMISGGTGYTTEPTVSLVPFGVDATAKAVVNIFGGIESITLKNPGSGYKIPPAVEIGGSGTGSGATATVSIKDGKIHSVSRIEFGSGYVQSETLTVTFVRHTPATATALIMGSVGSVEITDRGSGYTSPPELVFTPADGIEDGSGASATVHVDESLEVTGLSSIIKTDGGGIGSTARISVSTESPAPDGTPNGETVSTVTSTSKLVTLNGKTRTVTKMVYSGDEAAAPSNFPIRLILHEPDSGPPTLLQQVYLGSRDGTAYAGPDEGAIAALVTSPGPTPPGRIGRVSSASFPRGVAWEGTRPLEDSVNFKVLLGPNDETNPFVHTYHPDHDNWDERFEIQYGDGVESYEVKRSITLTFSPTLPAGVSDLNWGVTTLGGTYSEVISGLRSEEIAVSGRFILHQVSEVPALTKP